MRSTASAAVACSSSYGTATLTNCTVSGNSAGSNGGGLDNEYGTATLNECTVSGNTAVGNGGGVYTRALGSTTVSNTIVAGNTAATGGPDAFGTFTSQGNNLIGETDGSSGWVSSDLTGTIALPLDARLAPLGNYGGPTQTIWLLPGSPAINAGNIALIPAGITTDQRGDPRIVNGMVDIGAYETQSAVVPRYVVNTTADELDPSSSVTSLRYAIASADAFPGHAITFDPTVFASAQTISLTLGQLELSDTTGTETITGPAAGVTVSGGGQSRVFQVDLNVTASLSGLTITGGNATGNGGGLLNEGTTTLTNCTVSGNSASAGSGGGLANDVTIMLTNCTVSGNSDSINGGGVFNQGTATLTNCTVSGNTAASNGGGLATYFGGTTTATNTTVSGNSAVNGGGVYTSGFYQAGSNYYGTTNLTNCTVSGNSATGNGGGLDTYAGGTTTATNTTISGNSAAGNGGGLYNASRGSTTVANTIVAGNTATTSGPDAMGTFVSQGNNLIGETDGSSGWVGSDLTGTIALPLNPRLSPLGAYGGPTQTILLLPGSPAIGAGSLALIPTGVTTDQRGDPRLFNGKVDIGAYQSQAAVLPSFVVNTTADELNPSSSATSLRYAIASANAFPGHTITFDPTVFASAQTITLALGQLELSNTTGTETITGPAAGVTVSGGGLSRVFQVDGNVTASISGLTITGGNVTGNGGVTSDGGGVLNQGTATLIDCTVSGNSASSGSGGGLANNYGTMTLINSTVSGNSAVNGGGVSTSGSYVNGYYHGTTNLTNTTISGNSATGNGGGLYNASPGSTTVANTIVAGNTATTSGPDAMGTFASMGNNLIGKTDGSSGWVSSDLTGTVALSLNPLLAPLGHYGGPTQTMALLPGSPAIDAGSNVLAVDAQGNPLTTDQRGMPRIVGAAVDIGAFESSGFTLAVASGNNQSTTVGTAFPTALRVTITPIHAGDPVNGGVVTFTPPPLSGASAALNPSGAVHITSGAASVTATANAIAGGPYTVTAATAGAASVSFSLTNSSTTVTSPTVATPASATPSPATGTTTALSVLGADSVYGEPALTYTWTATTVPNGAPSPSFSINGTNASKHTTVTFHQAGSYLFGVTIANPGGGTVTSSVTVLVTQTLTAITVAPASPTVSDGATQSFTASASDQFGQVLAIQPSFTWSVDHGGAGGTVSMTGLYTAPSSGTGSDTVRATSGGVSGTAVVTVSAASSPTVATPAAASPSPATGTTTVLSVLGADSVYGEPALTYTWAATSVPSGATSPGFSINGTNASKQTTATFHQAGSYLFGVTIANPGGGTVTSSVTVMVSQTLTAISVAPTSATLSNGATQLFSATATDQFGQALTAQPAITWSVDGGGAGGTVSMTGLYTAPSSGTGSDTVRATSGSVSGTATVSDVSSAGLSDGSFESPSLGTGSGSFEYAPSGTAWSYSGGGGVAGNGSAFTSGNPNAPDGTQVGFLQANSSFSQVVAGMAAGTYEITFDAAQRGNYGLSQQNVQVLVDGVVVDALTPAGTSYATYTTDPFTVTAGSHTIAFQGLGTVNDTAFIDNVQLSQVMTSAGLSDGSFESPSLGTGSGSFEYAPSGTAWSYSGGGGVAGNGSAFTSGNPNAPDGTQVGFLQAGSSFSQVVAGMAAGTYEITFDAAQRGNFGVSQQNVQVLVDGVVVDALTPAGTSYATYTTNTFTVSAGSHTIAFQGLGTVNDTAFIDNVQLSQVMTSAGLSDGSFESPSVGTGSGSFEYAPSGTAWSYSGGGGVAGNGSAFTSGNPNAPDGTQVGFLQAGSSFSQVVAGMAAGTYEITFDAAQRGNFGVSQQNVQVLVDGVVVDALTPAGTSYATYTTNTFTVSAGSHTIAFQGLGTVDDTAFIDAVQLTQAMTSAVLSDASFESPSLGTGSGSFEYAPSGTAWSYSGGGGVAGNGSAFTSGNPNAPDGTQVGFLQAGSSFSQVVAGMAAGTYEITFDAAQRGNYGVSQQNVQVLVDGVVVDALTPAGTSYATYTTNTFTVSAGSHTIAFQGLGTVNDTAFIDEIRLVSA